MPENINSLLALPMETLGLLVAGYLGYRLAWTGKDESRRAVDVVFLSLAFGLVARAVMAGAGAAGWPAWAGIGAGVVAALLAAAVWRRWGQEASFRALRAARVSMSDGHRSALQSVIKRESIRISQVQVRRKNGAELMCDDVNKFADTPTGPYWFGEDGSIALYATDFRLPGENEWQECEDVCNQDWGDLITIIPADEVAMIKIRVT